MGILANLFGKKTFKKRGRLAHSEQNQAQQSWERLEQLAATGKPSAVREAIIEADKLLDFSLKILYPGRETAGERLKEAKELFGNARDEYEGLWYAHKIRNEMVHSFGFELPTTQAKDILEKFKKGLLVLGALR